MNLAAQLQTANGIGLLDAVVIANLSEHGARILSSRQWPASEHVVVSDGTGLSGFRATGRVIYCEALAAGQFALGLQFIEQNMPSWQVNRIG